MISPQSDAHVLAARLAYRLATAHAERTPRAWSTRFAPAPTGSLHLGHAVNAVYVWGLARALGGRVHLRIEDHDRGRARAEYERGILDDLDWLELAPDVGRTDEFRAGRHPLRQSDRADAYDSALKALSAARHGSVYACTCSRRDIAGPEGDIVGEELRYPGTCRFAARDPTATRARRVALDAGAVAFDDVALGPVSQDPSLQCGDVLVRDRVGNWTYQFAVVVDDMAHGIDVVIRGEDLLASTARQIRLAALLGRADPPIYLHHRLVRHAGGAKLSKSAGDTGLAELRRAGWSPARVLGEAVRLAGLRDDHMSIVARDLPALFAR